MPSVLKRKKKFKKDCCICLTDIQVENEARITSCRHRYHYDCIKQWSYKENSCPQCRRRFNWIIRIGSKRKERVRRRCQTDVGVPFFASLIQTFLTDGYFRRVMTVGIYERSPGALDILRALCNIISIIRRRNIILTIVDEETRTEAYAWLDTMEAMAGAQNLEHFRNTMVV